MIRIVKVNGLKGDARAGVCYVGRAFAGWPASLWGNPFKPKSPGSGAHCVNLERVNRDRAVEDCLSKFRAHAETHGPEYLASLWEACEHGTKPLGCWCIDATHGDGQPIVCHAQVLAEMLNARFVEGKE